MIPYVLTASEDEEAVARSVPDVGMLQVAKVYGEALLNAAEQAGQVDEVLGELEGLLESASQARSVIRQFFVSGVIGRQTRAEILKKVFAGKVHPLLLNFLLVVNEHDRMNLFGVMLFQAQQSRDQRARRLPVHLTSAVPLTDEQMGRIRDTVHNQLKLDPVVETKVDAEVLGGLMIRIGDWVFDGTVRTKLNELRNQLIERSSHEIQSGRDRFSTAV